MPGFGNDLVLGVAQGVCRLQELKNFLFAGNDDRSVIAGLVPDTDASSAVGGGIAAYRHLLHDRLKR
ncbi:hypothetical protein D3C78_1789510 [compost metagenome]